ncbi:MAG: putative tail fiber protein [Prokaryotic dsDNA virus sp.]|nr:MAG: putative tail fiber protein [Prokaryotic dsDNA virus sp.]
MAFSYETYTATGGQTDFPITFNYLPETLVVSASPAGILVYVNEVKQTSGYSVVGSNVVFASGLTASDFVRIVRVTPRGKADRLIDFADASVLTEAQLDTSALQLLYIAQEAFEQSTSGGSATPTYLPYSDTLTAWDAETKKISRVVDPVAATDAATKNYVDGEVTTLNASIDAANDTGLPYDSSAGTYNAQRSGSNKKIDNIQDPAGNQQAATKKYVDDIATWGTGGVPQAFVLTGTGSTNSFTLTGVPYAEAEMLIVSIDGVIQVPTTDFTVTGGATNSELIFVSYTPLDGEVINVQNFGKARVVDTSTLGDDSVTNSMMTDDSISAAEIQAGAVGSSELAASAVGTSALADSAVTTAKIFPNAVTTGELANSAVTAAKIADNNVTTAKLADDAVTKAKVADSSIDYDRLDETTFLPSNNTDSTAHVLKVAAGGQVLSHGTLGSADITDFSEGVTGKRLDEFAPPTSAVGMNGQALSNLPTTPAAANDAASRAYVDANTQSAMRGTLIADLTHASGNEFVVDGWFDDSKYKWYQFVCMGFRSNTNDRMCVAGWRDNDGWFTGNSSTPMKYCWQVGGVNVNSQSKTGRAVMCTPKVDHLDDNRDYHHFTLTIPHNHTGFNLGKTIISEGVGSCAVGSTSQPGLGDDGYGTPGYAPYKIVSHNTNSTTPIQGLKFWFAVSGYATEPNDYFSEGARVLVYGYEGLS